MEMGGRHPELVWHVGGALHSNSKEWTTMQKKTDPLRDLRPSALRLESDDNDDPFGCQNTGRRFVASFV